MHQQKGFCPSLIFEGGTRYLSKLHCHLTQLSPGAGYKAQRNDHDVAIVLLAGEILVNQKKLEKVAVVYYAGGELHNMLNPGTETASYLVFEFHD